VVCKNNFDHLKIKLAFQLNMETMREPLAFQTALNFKTKFQKNQANPFRLRHHPSVTNLFCIKLVK